MSSNIIVVYGTSWCGDTIRARRVLDGRGVSYVWVDIDLDTAGEALVLEINRGMRSVPTIVFPDGSILVEPTTATLNAELDRFSAGRV